MSVLLTLGKNPYMKMTEQHAGKTKNKKKLR